MKRNFIQNSEAWYGKPCLKDKNLVDEFVIFVEDDKGHRLGEFIVAFMQLGGRMTVSAQIQCFDDGARALEQCQDVIEFIAVLHEVSRSSQPHQFLNQLIANGYNNVTPKYATDTMEVDIVKSIKDDIFDQIKSLQGTSDWDSVPGQLMSIGLFIKDGKSFVAAINVGAPDSDVDIIGATIYGSASIAVADEHDNHLETLDMLLVESEKFFQAYSPNHLVGS